MMKKSQLPQQIQVKCHGIIHSFAAAAGGVGAAGAQIPVADAAIITPLQISMIIALAKVFERNITRETALAILKGASTAIVGRAVSQLLVGWIPGIGNMINMGTAAGLTEAVGWVSVVQFYTDWLKQGHTIEDIPVACLEAGDVEDIVIDPKQVYRDDLCAQAQLFIEGEKDAKGADKDEFYELFKEMGYETNGLSADDPFIITFNALAECLK